MGTSTKYGKGCGNLRKYRGHQYYNLPTSNEQAANNLQLTKCVTAPSASDPKCLSLWSASIWTPFRSKAARLAVRRSHYGKKCVSLFCSTKEIGHLEKEGASSPGGGRHQGQPDRRLVFSRPQALPHPTQSGEGRVHTQWQGHVQQNYHS